MIKKLLRLLNLLRLQWFQRQQRVHRRSTSQSRRNLQMTRRLRQQLQLRSMKPCPKFHHRRSIPAGTALSAATLTLPKGTPLRKEMRSVTLRNRDIMSTKRTKRRRNILTAPNHNDPHPDHLLPSLRFPVDPSRQSPIHPAHRPFIPPVLLRRLAVQVIYLLMLE